MQRRIKNHIHIWNCSFLTKHIEELNKSNQGTVLETKHVWYLLTDKAKQMNRKQTEQRADENRKYSVYFNIGVAYFRVSSRHIIFFSKRATTSATSWIIVIYTGLRNLQRLHQIQTVRSLNQSVRYEMEWVERYELSDCLTDSRLECNSTMRCGIWRRYTTKYLVNV